MFYNIFCINLLGPDPGIDEFSGEGDRGVHQGQNLAKVLLQYDEFEFHLKIVHDNVLLQSMYQQPSEQTPKMWIPIL